MSNIVQKRGINSLIFVQIYTIIPTNQKYQNKKDRKNLLYQKKAVILHSLRQNVAALAQW